MLGFFSYHKYPVRLLEDWPQTDIAANKKTVSLTCVISRVVFVMCCYLVYSSGNDQGKVSKHLGEAQEVTFPLRAAEEGRQREYNLYIIMIL